MENLKKDILGKTIALLNNLLKQDPDAVHRLINARVGFSELPSDVPSIEHDGHSMLGVLGLLNYALLPLCNGEPLPVRVMYLLKCDKCGDSFDEKVGQKCPCGGNIVLDKPKYFFDNNNLG